MKKRNIVEKPEVKLIKRSFLNLKKKKIFLKMNYSIIKSLLRIKVYF